MFDKLACRLPTEMAPGTIGDFSLIGLRLDRGSLFESIGRDDGAPTRRFCRVARAVLLNRYRHSIAGDTVLNDLQRLGACRGARGNLRIHLI